MIKDLYDNIVIGSGPGGSMTSCLLAESGREALLLEEGGGTEGIEPFSRAEMLEQYRNGGITMAFGKPRVQYVEAKTLGGGSEINSGLYHRLPDAKLEMWREQYKLSITADELARHSQIIERDLSVSLLPHAAPTPSLLLSCGAEKLGFKCIETPRWHKYETDDHTGQRQTMRATYIPRAVKEGAVVRTNFKAVRISKRGDLWRVDSGRTRFRCRHLFLSCGAIQTPSLLARSGVAPNAGKNLHLHPTIKVIAHFPDEINSRAMGVPVHQVKEWERISLGCSISNPQYLSAAMLAQPNGIDIVRNDWKRLAVYYAMIVPEGRGTVRALPLFNDPLVTMRLTEGDLSLLADALRKLCETLFAAGADRLYPTAAGLGVFENPNDLARIPARLDAAALMTIHLTSTANMAGEPQLGVCDQFGAVWGQKNLFVSDASLLPSAPGVNPQGALLALVRRNVERFVREGA